MGQSPDLCGERGGGGGAMSHPDPAAALRRLSAWCRRMSRIHHKKKCAAVVFQDGRDLVKNEDLREYAWQLGHVMAFHRVIDRVEKIISRQNIERRLSRPTRGGGNGKRRG